MLKNDFISKEVDISRKVINAINSMFREQQNLRGKVERLEKIMDQLIWWEKLESLEKEKASLLVELESLKEDGESKANELEKEVMELRKEVKRLKKVLNKTEKH